MRLAYSFDGSDQPKQRTASTAEPRYNTPRLPGKTAADSDSILTCNNCGLSGSMTEWAAMGEDSDAYCPRCGSEDIQVSLGTIASRHTAAGERSRIDIPDGPIPGVPAEKSDVDFALGFQFGFRSNSAGTPLSDTKMLPKDAPKPSDDSPFADGWRSGYVYALDSSHGREPKWVRDLLDWYFTSTFDDRRSAFGSKTAAGNEWQPFPKVTDQQAQKFVEAARKIGYSISVDAAYDILLLSGGYNAAMSSASILESLYGDVNAAGGIDVDSGYGISALIESTDYAGWVYNSRDFKPTKADCEKMIGMLRTQGQRDALRRFVAREFGATASRHTAAAGYRIVYGWDVYEDFATLEEANQRIADMLADPPRWAGQSPYTWPPEILDLGSEAPYSRVSARRTAASVVKTVCSGCGREVVLDMEASEARVKFSGNGLRGQKHVPGGVGVAELEYDDNGLIMWDCPVCDYADSYEDDSSYTASRRTAAGANFSWPIIRSQWEEIADACFAVQTSPNSLQSASTAKTWGDALVNLIRKFNSAWVNGSSTAVTEKANEMNESLRQVQGDADMPYSVAAARHLVGAVMIDRPDWYK